MKRNLSGLGVTIAGLLLAVVGGFAMWTGWDMILVERGWSLFIAGAAAISGGVVTIALGRVVALLARLAEPPAILTEIPTASARQAIVVAPSAPIAPQREAQIVEPSPSPPPAPAFELSREAPPSASLPRQRFTRSAPSLTRKPIEPDAPPAVSASAPKEVDRYASGDSTYIMMSDGSVEVHGPAGVQRYDSLAALKAEAAPKSR